MTKNHLFNPELGELNDFKNFLYLVWQFLELPEPTQLQYDIADYLQHADNPWSIIMAYRGVGKSYITAAFVVWLWLINPNFKILVISASEDKAKDFAMLVKQIIFGMELCQHLKPRKGMRDAITSFDVGPCQVVKDPSLNVYGITGQITGGRADFIVPDDVETPDNSATVVQRDKLFKKLGEIIAIIKGTTDDHQPQIKMLGTPQTEASIYYEQEKAGFSIRIWPSEYPVDVTKYKGRLAPKLLHDLRKDPSLVGKPTNPKMHDERDLKKRRQRKAFYQLQYMLDPSLSDSEKYPLKLKDLIVAHVDSEMGPTHLTWADDPRTTIQDPSYPMPGLAGDRWMRPWVTSERISPYVRRIMAIDPAGGVDWTAYCVVYVLCGFAFLAKWGAVQSTGKTNMEFLADIARDHKVDTVVIERNYGASINDDGEKTSSFIELFKPILARKVQAGIKPVHNTGRKEQRICDTLEEVMASHRLVVCDTVVKEDGKVPEEHLRGFWQLTHIMRTPGALLKDDMADVLSIAIAEVLQDLSLDTEANEEKLAQEAFEKQLERFVQNASKGRSKAREENWLSLEREAFSSSGDSLEDALMDNSPWYERQWDDR